MGTGGERLWVRPNLTGRAMTSAQKLAVGLNDSIAGIGYQANDFFTYAKKYLVEDGWLYYEADGRESTWSDNWNYASNTPGVKRYFGCTHPLKIERLTFDLYDGPDTRGDIPAEVRLYGSNANPGNPEILLATYLVPDLTPQTVNIALQVVNPDWYRYYSIWASTNISIKELIFTAYTRS